MKEDCGLWAKPLPFAGKQQTTTVFLYFVIGVWTISSSSAEKLPLKGETFRCCSIISDPYTIDTGIPGVYGGLVIDYIHNLEMALGFQCSYEIYNPADNGVGFNALIHSISNCSEGGNIRSDPACTCDIGIASWFPTYERSYLNIDFVQPFVHDDYGIMTRIEDTYEASNRFFFLTAFSSAAWGCIFSLLVLFTALRVLDQNYYPFPGPENAGWKASLSHFFFKRMRNSTVDTARIAVGGDPVQTNFTPKSTMRRTVLDFIIALIGIFLVLLYEATMTANLVSENFNAAFKDVSNLKNCEIPHEQFGIVTGDATETNWNSSIGSICPNGSTSNGPKKYKTEELLMKALATSKEVNYVLMDRATGASYVNGKYCTKLVFTGRSMLRFGASIVLPKGSKYTTTFNRATMMLNEMGLLRTIDEFLAGSQCTSRGHATTIYFRRLSMFFFMAFTAGALVYIDLMVHPQKAKDNSTPMGSSRGNVVGDEATVRADRPVGRV